MNDAIDHPEAAQLVDSLVAAGGGLVAYDVGAPGREIAVAAGARLAARTGTTLTVIDFRHLLPQAGAIVAREQPDLSFTPLPAAEAVRHPERNTGGVLVVHADLLHDPDTCEALLQRAEAAGSLIMASHTGPDESLLGALPGPRFVVSAPGTMPPAQPNTPAPEIHWRIPAANGTSPADSIFAGMAQRRERMIRQLQQEVLDARAPGTGEDSSTALGELTEADLAELASLLARVQRQQAQRAADYPDPGPEHKPTHDHGQAQATAHQQQGPQGISRT
ncbi:hypothetical protein ABT160_29950 [Streptomyces sp. NPDC001941]|uniref:hypothetical protein n=1 Tax=Streptomyces sp. NPDC001941 TaxID=3154659 RepID=UPI00332A8047